MLGVSQVVSATEMRFLFIQYLSSCDSAMGQATRISAVSFLLTGLLLCAFCQIWHITMPEKVFAVEGSCIVIPCQFYYSGPRRTITSVVWYTAQREKVYDSRNTEAVSSNFKGRTHFLGNLTQNNCTLRIDKTTPSDHLKRFSILICLDDIQNITVKSSTLNVSDGIGVPRISTTTGLREGVPSTITCSVVHGCPTSPPSLQWISHSMVSVHHKELSSGIWETTATLTFIPSFSDHRKKLQCVATLYAGKNASAAIDLTVEYKPRIFPNSSCTVYGDMVRCECWGVSSSPVDFEWDVGANRSLAEFNHSSAIHDHQIRGFLIGRTGIEDNISCSSANQFGNVSYFLTVFKGRSGDEQSVQWWIAALVTLVIVLVLTAILAFTWRRIHTWEVRDLVSEQDEISHPPIMRPVMTRVSPPPTCISVSARETFHSNSAGEKLFQSRPTAIGIVWQKEDDDEQEKRTSKCERRMTHNTQSQSSEEVDADNIYMEMHGQLNEQRCKEDDDDVYEEFHVTKDCKDTDSQGKRLSNLSIVGTP
ncbi:sialic acid-binding Ig-like lectin 5 [Lepisosteus oculatus]|uniref:sialic acid-binding Ig-like lectin 5 n=1 Tax=Lepisosteus oculatus TaxID=7918 RepID=UPI00371DF161